MKSKEEMIQMLVDVADRLQTGVNTAEEKVVLHIKLALLYDILGDDVPEEYAEGTF